MNKNLTVRIATPEDVSFISNTESTVFSDPWSSNSVHSLIDDKHHTVFTAENDGFPVGYAIVSSVAGESELLRIATSPAMRRVGIGGALLDCVISSRTKAGDEVIYLEVRSTNSSAIGLYTSRGFETYAIRRNYYRNPTEDATMMRLILCK